VKRHMPLEKICNIPSIVGMEVVQSKSQNLATQGK
jgi:hypothetical protein